MFPSAQNTIAHIAILVSTCAMSSAQDAAQKSMTDYAESIAKAQADLDSNRIAEARQKLDATDKRLRSFEYAYLVARADNATQGTAPDLIQTIDLPHVDSRHAVLNSVNHEVAFLCRDGSLRVYELGNLKTPEKTVMHEDPVPVWSGAFSFDGSTFVAGLDNGKVVVWNAKTWKQRSTVPVGSKPVRELAVAPDGTAFIAEGEKTMELWSVAESEPKKIADVGERLNFGEGLAFSPKGDLLATGGMFDIQLYNAKTGEQLHSMRHASYTMGLEFSPDGTRIASAPRGNVNKFLAVFDVAQGNMLFNSGPFRCYVHGGVFTSDGQRIISTACEKIPSLQLFDSATGQVVLSIARQATGSRPACTSNGKILGWSEPKSYRFIDLAKQRID